MFATNEGIYYFDYYSFKKIECDKTKSSSVFNFVIDSDGLVYCHNLNSQLFKIKNAKCELFYELKNDERSSDISLIINDKNELVIGAKKIIVMDNKGSVVKRYSFINHYLGPSFIAPNKAVHFHLGGSDTILAYAQGVFSKHKLSSSSGALTRSSVLKLFTIGSISCALDLRTRMLFKYDATNYDLTLLQKNKLFELEGLKRIYEIGNEIWIAGTLPGVFRISTISDTSKFFYEDYFISNVFKDHEGNILLSTFDKGVLVIPDINVPDVISSFRDDPVTAIHTNNKYGLIIGTSKGKLLNYLNGELRLLKGSAKRSVEGIYGDANGSFILFENGGCTLYNLQSGEMKNLVGASLKDAVVVSENKYFIGTNLGIYRINKTSTNEFSCTLLKGMNNRVYSIEYDRKSAHLYASTTNGLFMIDSLENAEKIVFQNEDVFPTNIYECGGSIYVCTEKRGVLEISKGKIKRIIEPKINDKIETIKKMIITNNTIIASSTNGFFQFKMDGALIRTIPSAAGFKTKKVNDFKMMNDYLWVSHSGGVQQFDLNSSKNNTSRPLVRFDNIAVNDKLRPLAELGRFTSNERKIHFVFSSPSLKNKENIKYHYKLEGYDTAWVINGFELNFVTYNALDAGNYTFMVRAENQGFYSNVAAYSFTIMQPIYARWWFIMIMITSVGYIITIVYRWQLKLQQKKLKQINELNASKLAAIQSQMNPHFIFNSLNSIQDLVLKGDVENSYSYISTFSDLVRRTLNYSDKDFIEFEQEIKLLNLYLLLEKLRFKKNFNFEINIGNVEDIMIPPMLIQPFIENSLAHGLLHKEGEKKLSVLFQLNEVLVCTIEDNGIGREKAKAIKQRQNKGHESFSGKAIGKRLEILSDVFEGNFGYVYEDLFDENEPAGTRVILTIPIKRKF